MLSCICQGKVDIMETIINIKSDINKFLRINYTWFFPSTIIAIFQIVFWILDRRNLLDLTKVDHNAIMTINLTLAGFLLTGIGIMISIRDKEFIQTLIRAGYWKMIERSVFLGITFNIFSALLSLGNLIIKNSNIVVFNLEMSTFILGMTYFILVVVWLKKSLQYL